MSQLIPHMPESIGTFIDPFTGGGSSFLNVDAKSYFANDVNESLVSVHQYLSSFSKNSDDLFSELYELIDFYGFTCSYRGKLAPAEVREKYPKTYYAQQNKAPYMKLRADFNKTKASASRLYLLLVYGFNHMIRFNRSGDFNLPVGNVDFNKNVATALHDYIRFMSLKTVEFSSLNYSDFLGKIEIQKDDFIYLDPPYLISHSEYNKLWNETKESMLYKTLDDLNSRGLKFGVSNLLEHKGRLNHHLLEWSAKYKIVDIQSNYISFNDNSIKRNSREVYVTNHE
jgi:DNA adenine methylase